MSDPRIFIKLVKECKLIYKKKKFMLPTVTAWPSWANKYNMTIHLLLPRLVFNTLLPAEHLSIFLLFHPSTWEQAVQSRLLSGSHIAPFLMIKEVICRLKLHLSLSLHKLSVTVQRFLYNFPTVDKAQYKHVSVTQRPTPKVNCIQLEIRRSRNRSCFQSHLELDITTLLWFTFDIFCG